MRTWTFLRTGDLLMAQCSTLMTNREGPSALAQFNSSMNWFDVFLVLLIAFTSIYSQDCQQDFNFRLCLYIWLNFLVFTIKESNWSIFRWHLLHEPLLIFVIMDINWNFASLKISTVTQLDTIQTSLAFWQKLLIDNLWVMRAGCMSIKIA